MFRSLKKRACATAVAMFALLAFASLAIGRQAADTTQATKDQKSESQPDARQNPAKSAPKSKTDRKSKKRIRRDPTGFYMGRQIAQVMSWEEFRWLFRETRIEEEQPEAMLDALSIPKGATIADVGAGAGYHSIRLARRVGSKGTVLASDIQPEMIRMLQENARNAGVANIKSIRATQSDPRLPESKVDLILMVDVYHECSDPETVLHELLKALKPRGRLVLVEFRAEDPDVPIRPEHKMTLDQVRREVEPQGFVFQQSLEFLPWQHIIIFEKPAEAQKETPASTDKDGKTSPATTTKSS
jgi:ubiquinone/menaquinone biosynthesis C-methylase UbiE